MDAELLYGEWLIEDAGWGDGGSLLITSLIVAQRAKKNALNLFYGPRGAPESL